MEVDSDEDSMLAITKQLEKILANIIMRRILLLEEKWMKETCIIPILRLILDMLRIYLLTCLIQVWVCGHGFHHRAIQPQHWRHEEELQQQMFPVSQTEGEEGLMFLGRAKVIFKRSSNLYCRLDLGEC